MVITVPISNPTPPAADGLQLPVEIRQSSGLHLVGDFFDCECTSEWMLDAAWIENFCKSQVTSAGLTCVDSLFHSFGNAGGVTGMVLLAESHLSIHTWPEDAYVTLDVYVCNYSANNRRKAQQLFDAIQAAFHPCTARVQYVERGIPVA